MILGAFLNSHHPTQEEVAWGLGEITHILEETTELDFATFQLTGLACPLAQGFSQCEKGSAAPESQVSWFRMQIMATLP